MIYALTITIAAGLILLVLLVLGLALARRVADGDWSAVGRWRWYPSPLGLLLLAPIAALLLFRFLPAILLIPVVVPFFWRNRRIGRTLFFIWNLGRSVRPPGDDDGHDRTIEGQARPLDDE